MKEIIEQLELEREYLMKHLAKNYNTIPERMATSSKLHKVEMSIALLKSL